jgi:hypothetical protein
MAYARCRWTLADRFATALDVPFFLLPFRPTSDPSAAKTFIRNFFDREHRLQGEFLMQELKLTEVMVCLPLNTMDLNAQRLTQL